MIYLDRRTGSKDLEPLIRALRVPVELADLDFGDCCFEGNGQTGKVMVCVERKTLSDILDCMTTGRFAGYQLPGMLSRYEHCYLVVEGQYQPGPYGCLNEMTHWGWRPVRNVTYHTLDAYLTSLEATTRLRLRRAISPEETAAVVVSLWHFYQKHWREHSATKVFHEEPGPGPLVSPGLVRRMAKELPGVGWERSAAVAARFNTPAEMVNADPEVWLDLPGFGPKMAVKAYKALWRKG